MISTSNRIKEILDWVNGPVIADIGCDHAYVCVNAILQNKATKAYACDVASGPLENAKSTIHEYHVEDKVLPCLLNGIHGLNSDVNQIIICGMGGKLIIDILDNGNVLLNQRLLLSPHKDSYALREYLMNHEFKIVREKMVKDGNHFYPILDCIKTKGCYCANEASLYFGINMIQNDVYNQYLDFEESKIRGILTHASVLELEKKLDFIKKLRNQSIS